jgi:hypothetical protein
VSANPTESARAGSRPLAERAHAASHGSSSLVFGRFISINRQGQDVIVTSGHTYSSLLN